MAPQRRLLCFQLETAPMCFSMRTTSASTKIITLPWKNFFTANSQDYLGVLARRCFRLFQVDPGVTGSILGTQGFEKKMLASSSGERTPRSRAACIPGR